MVEPSPGRDSTGAAVYRVGDLLVDFSRAQVFRDGTELPLPKLSFDLLQVLVQDAPGIVTFDGLMDRVWKGVIVSPETVSQRAKLLRDALGDDPRQPRYVAAVRGRGYRLVAPVRREFPNAAEGAAPTPSAPAPAAIPAAAGASWSRRTHPWLVRTALLVALLAALAVLALWLLRRDGEAVRELAQPSTISGSAQSVAVLPFENMGATQGEALALGIAEAVLHQLANLRQVTVIARTSSFAYAGKHEDVRRIGRELGARYLLEGSVQQDGGRLRVTAQLVDTASGAHVWSMQFDETLADVFAVQDTIALQVARALQLSIDTSASDRLVGQGTTDFDAYLAFLQGRALLGSRRQADVATAVGHFRTAIAVDPEFAPALVALAEAEVFVAEYDIAADRSARFDAALERAAAYIARALELDPDLGAAYLQRGYLQAFSDLQAAAASYRRGIELSPNDARGHAGLAAILFEDLASRPEALALIDRARRLDPLEPAHDVTKATFLLYDLGDVDGAAALLRHVLRRQPLYQPALARLGELYWCCARRFAESVQHLEQALSLDPASAWSRRLLVRAYLTLDDLAAARDVVASAPLANPILELPIALHAADWDRAGELAVAAFDAGLVAPVDAVHAVLAVRRQARLSGDYGRAIEVLERHSGVTWDEDGAPRLPARIGLRDAETGLVDLLIASGQPERGRALASAVLAQADAELAGSARSEFWYLHTRAPLLALLGQREAALAALQRGVEAGVIAHRRWDLFERDPALDGIRGDPRFDALLAGLREHARAERELLERMRQDGRAPRRP